MSNKSEQHHMDRVCTVGGCDKKHYGKGLCTKHYQRMVNTGSVELKPKILSCIIPGCNGKYKSKGYCIKHYTRYLRYGDPLFVSIIVGDDRNRLLSKVVKSKNGCWEWSGVKKNGYGIFSLNQKDHQAHRASWILLVGEIEDGMQINHKCHNRACVNPDHLYQGTQKENMRDMEMSGRANRAYGDRSGVAKLSSDQVVSIKEKINKGLKNSEIAIEYNVYPTTISSIRNGKTWSHVK